MTAATEHLATRVEFPCQHETLFPGQPESVGEFRHWLATVLAGVNVRIDDVLRAASELATNAVIHSASRLPGKHFAAWVGHNTRYVQVVIVDGGPLDTPADGDREGGWGLLIVRDVTDACGWDSGLGGRRVAWFRIHLNEGPS